MREFVQFTGLRSFSIGRAFVHQVALLVWLFGWSGSLLAMADDSPLVLDDFEELQGWHVVKTEGVRMEIAHDRGVHGQAMRLDFDFGTGAGYALVRKELPIPLPSNYEFRMRLRASAPDNNFEFKLIDRSGKNVWWLNQRDYQFPTQWQDYVIKKRHLNFAWGPRGGEPNDITAIELAITAGEGGKGSVWLDDLTLVPRPALPSEPSEILAEASTSAPGSSAALAVDQDAETVWRSGAIAEDQWLLLNFQQSRVFGALVIDWDEQDFARDYLVETSVDGQQWQEALSIKQSNGGRDYLYLPDSEARMLRFTLQRSSRAAGYAIRNIDIKPYSYAETPNRFFESLASDSQPGFYPKYFSGKQSYWTVIGVPNDDKEALLNEEGALEVDHAAFSIEPFLFVDGQLVTWSQVETEQSLRNGYLPIPTATWRFGKLLLHVTAWADGEGEQSVLHARYRVENQDNAPRSVRLFLAIRPFQVNPPWQALNKPGGVARVAKLALQDQQVVVNDDKRIQLVTAPQAFGAAAFYQGSVLDFLQHGELPSDTWVKDPFERAAGALAYDLSLPAQGREEVYLSVPFHKAGAQRAHTEAKDPDAEALAAASLQNTVGRWTRLLDRASFNIPGDRQQIANTLKTTVAYILINQDGAAIQPGSRSYERSWIRDGAMTSTALLHMGYNRQVRAFIQWFAGHQFENGKVPCCIDARGADPIPEHDSNGAFIYLITEYYRFTHDIGLVRQLWPQVVKAVDYIDQLRQRRLTEEYSDPAKLAYRGLLPESISHEGYAADPVHSYWDDFFAVRGLSDAVVLARVMGESRERVRFERIHQEFEKSLHDSVVETMRMHNIDFIPGSVELGDFDGPSTAIALVPGEQRDNLPSAALQHTFDRFYQYFTDRRAGRIAWSNYSPYEARLMGAYVRLHQPQRALELMEFLLADRRPAGWNAWGEIVWRDPESPRYVGDMPHTWVASEFVRAIRSLFVYERLRDDSLVLAAGLPAQWLERDTGVEVKRLPTYFGTLNYRLNSPSADRLLLSMDGDIRMGSGAIELYSPIAKPITSVTVNGKPVDSFDQRRVTINEFPAEVEVKF